MRVLSAVSILLAAVTAAAPAEEKARARVTFGMVWDVSVPFGGTEPVLRISTPLQPEDKVGPKFPGKKLDRTVRPKEDKVELTRLGKPAAARDFKVGDPVRVTMTPDGKVKAVALMEALEPRSKFEAHPRGVGGVWFSPDGKTLATVSTLDGTVRLWDAKTQKPLHTLETGYGGLSGGPVDLKFSPDGKVIFARLHLPFGPGKDGEKGKPYPRIRRWEVASGKELPRLAPMTEGGGSYDISPDGKTLAVGDIDAAVFYDLPGGKEARRVKTGHAVFGILFLADGKHFIYGGREGVCRRTLEGAEVKATGKSRIKNMYGFRLTPDGKHVSCMESARGESWLVLLDAGTFRQAVGSSIPKGWIYDHGAAAGGKWLAAALGPLNSRTIPVRLIDPGSGLCQALLGVPGKKVARLAFSPDGRTLAGVCEKDARVYIWDVPEPDQSERKWEPKK